MIYIYGGRKVKIALKALLTLDLDRVTSDQRKVFYEHLKKENWIKIDNIDTAWKCTFNDGVSRQDAISTCMKDVENAAYTTGVSSIKSVVQVGNGDVEEL